MKKIIENIKGKNLVKKNIFYVPVDKVLIGFGGIGSFTLSNYNPYVCQVKELINNPEINYQNSLNKRIRNNIKKLIDNKEFGGLLGKDLQEELKEFVPKNIPKKIKNKENIIFIPYISWITAQSKSNELKQYIHGYSLGQEKFYPRKKDFQVLKKVYKSINKNGYNPDEYASINSSFIQGTLLKDGWDFKCHISSGRHRAAVLAALGYKEIPVIFYDNRKSMNKLRTCNYHHILDTNNTENWLAVKHGIYPEYFIKKLFHLHFKPEEKQKAEMLGIKQGDKNGN